MGFATLSSRVPRKSAYAGPITSSSTCPSGALRHKSAFDALLTEVHMGRCLWEVLDLEFPCLGLDFEHHSDLLCLSCSKKLSYSKSTTPAVCTWFF